VILPKSRYLYLYDSLKLYFIILKKWLPTGKYK
jgi:hypothetical protein